MDIIKTALKHRRTTLFLAAMVAVAGIFAYFPIPKQENPDVASPSAMLTTILPGGSPNDMEQLVTKKLEDAVSEIQGIDNIQSWSAENLSIVLITLKNGVDSESAWTTLRRLVQDVQTDLPDGSEKTTIDTKIIETAGMIISLSGTKYSYEQLESFALQYKDALSSIDGIDRFDIVGKVEKEVVVELDSMKIRRFGIDMSLVAELLQAQNVAIPSGSIKTEDGKISVRVPGQFESLKDIENTILTVSAESGHILKLKDVADISFRLKEDAKTIRQNGDNAVLLAGFFRPGRNIIPIGREVRSVLNRMKQQLPEDLIVTEVTFEPEDINRSVTSFMSNVIQGIVLVIAVVFLGMGFRNAITVSLAIPLSIVITFLTMNFLGIKIHQISTATLIIAMGMLVDNAIVVSDSIQVRLDKGMNRFGAALEGAKKSAVPIFSATLTTVAAFSPLLSLPGAGGEFLEAIPQIVIISLLVSFMVALFVTPSVSSYLLIPTPEAKGKGNKRLLKIFRGILSWGLSHKGLTIGIAIVALIGSFLLTKTLPSQLFPTADKNIVYIDIYGDIADIDRTDRLARTIENILDEQEEITSYTTSLGDDLPRFYITASVATPATDYAQIMLRVDLDKTDRFSKNRDIAIYLQDEIDSEILGGYARVRLLESTDPKDGSVLLRVSGDDMPTIENAAGIILDELKNLDGTINHRSDVPMKRYKYMVDVDEDAALANGVSKYHIQRQINLALMGDAVSVYRKSGNEYDIRLKSNVSTIEDLVSLPILSGQNRVMLRQVAQSGLYREYEMIKKYNKKRSVAVYCDTSSGVSPSEIENIMESEVLPNLDLGDVKITFAGDREEIKKAFGNLGMAALVALALIYIILLIQFDSFIQPLVIMVSVPLSLVGAILGLWVFSQPLSFTAVLGIASLIGIVVNNAILLIEFINDALGEGKSSREACLEAVEKRFRPITLTTITTVMGLIPLAVSGSELFAPMTIALMGGLLVSTLLTLVVIPVVYTVLIRPDRRRRAVSRNPEFGQTPTESSRQ